MSRVDCCGQWCLGSSRVTESIPEHQRTEPRTVCHIAPPPYPHFHCSESYAGKTNMDSIYSVPFSLVVTCSLHSIKTISTTNIRACKQLIRRKKSDRNLSEEVKCQTLVNTLLVFIENGGKKVQKTVGYCAHKSLRLPQGTATLFILPNQKYVQTQTEWLPCQRVSINSGQCLFFECTLP